MHTNKNTFFKLLNSIAGLALASVMNTATAADVAVEVKFAAVVHSEAFECGKSYANIGTTEISHNSTECSFCQITQHLVGLIDCPPKQSSASIAKFARPIAPHYKAFKTLQWGLPQSRAPPIIHS